jgi:hypothetical protein
MLLPFNYVQFDDNCIVNITVWYVVSCTLSEVKRQRFGEWVCLSLQGEVEKGNVPQQVTKRDSNF